jgi:hypothetical protein
MWGKVGGCEVSVGRTNDIGGTMTTVYAVWECDGIDTYLLSICASFEAAVKVVKKDAGVGAEILEQCKDNTPGRCKWTLREKEIIYTYYIVEEMPLTS